MIFVAMKQMMVYVFCVAYDCVIDFRQASTWNNYDI